MDHVPMDDIKELWNDMTEQSWTGLRMALENKQNRAEGIDDTLVMDMKNWVAGKENSGESFPNSPEELSEMINGETAGEEEQGEAENG